VNTKEKTTVTKKVVSEKVSERKPINMFTVLDVIDSEFEEKKKQEPYDDFPELKTTARSCTISKTPKTPILTGYAAMAAKIAPKIEANVEAKLEPVIPPTNIDFITRPTNVFNIGRSWADDWSDSDDEEQFDEEQFDEEYYDEEYYDEEMELEY
jgi:hypothetical protein